MINDNKLNSYANSNNGRVRHSISQNSRVSTQSGKTVEWNKSTQMPIKKKVTLTLPEDQEKSNKTKISLKNIRMNSNCSNSSNGSSSNKKELLISSRDKTFEKYQFQFLSKKKSLKGGYIDNDYNSEIGQYTSHDLDNMNPYLECYFIKKPLPLGKNKNEDSFTSRMNMNNDGEGSDLNEDNDSLTPESNGLKKKIKAIRKSIKIINLLTPENVTEGNELKNSVDPSDSINDTSSISGTGISSSRKPSNSNSLNPLTTTTTDNLQEINNSSKEIDLEKKGLTEKLNFSEDFQKKNSNEKLMNFTENKSKASSNHINISTHELNNNNDKD